MSLPLHTQHQRSFERNRFVYPVLSRRSGGLSVGVNLNPDKVCNFDCIYCQVDRTSQSETRFVELEPLLDELRDMLDWIASGKLFDTEKFRSTPPELRRLKDIAFSGDGEPTTYQNFDAIIEACAKVKKGYRPSAIGYQPEDTMSNRSHADSRQPTADNLAVKMVLITNASIFHRPHVMRGLAILDDNQGEIWAKLDAGTEAYYRQIERTPIPFQQILDNIGQAARVRPIVIQSLFMLVDGVGPSTEELEAYCCRLLDITNSGGKISLVQVYTIARRPAESSVSSLTDAQVDAIAELVGQRTGLPATAYYGSEDLEPIPEPKNPSP